MIRIITHRAHLMAGASQWSVMSGMTGKPSAAAHMAAVARRLKHAEDEKLVRTIIGDRAYEQMTAKVVTAEDLKAAIDG